MKTNEINENIHNTLRWTSVHWVDYSAMLSSLYLYICVRSGHVHFFYCCCCCCCLLLMLCLCVYIYISFSSLYTRQRHSVKTQHSVSDMHIRFRGIFDVICVCTQSSNKFLLWHLLLVLPTQRHKAFQTTQRAFCFDSKVYLNLQCFALNCMFFPIERFCQLILSYDFDSFMHIEHQKRWHNWNTLTLVYCFWMNAIVSNVVVIAYLHAGNW